ncbi:S-layer homology domain-containing protein [Schnuerera sp. xch1]|uniref:S-layer homology domain-containing protein n=1 Tax=Schnuerera sp. xch1 TaxID=2874283 RepID=UPI001CBE480A|nr:S-layer homology domain-containing protein [Schnuerera sp. xch1]MBZ2174963.1 S-layer homology domain-containing protein [Schnuerera sp. xch1]
MKRNVISLILVFSFVFTGITAYGESMFTDIDSNHWAYDYIEKVVDLGIMDGYEDATFRPNETVNIVETLTYITRLLNIHEDEVVKMRDNYDTFLEEYDLSEEEKDAVAIALSANLLNEQFIENNLMIDGDVRKVIKTELAIYLAKAMGMEEQKKNTYIFSYNFYNDIEKIPETARPYINFLIDKGVLGKKGDGNGNFNPNQHVTRAVLAKMLSIAYNHMNGIPFIVPEIIEEPTEPENQNYSDLSGIIVLMLRDYIFIDDGQKIDSYTLEEDVEITINGEIASFDMLEEGMHVKASVLENNVIEAIGVDSDSNITYGTIDNMSLSETRMMVKTKVGDIKTFNLSREPEVVIDGNESYLYSLHEGDMVTVEALEDFALSIEAESKDGRVEGIIKEKIFEEECILLVERKNGSTYRYAIDKDTIIDRNANEVTVKDLRIGDEVLISLTDGNVSTIDAKSVLGEDRGYIESILISDESMLTIINDQGDKKSYYISEDVMITLEDEKMSIYDLRLDDYVRLELESDEIVNINK